MFWDMKVKGGSGEYTQIRPFGLHKSVSVVNRKIELKII